MKNCLGIAAVVAVVSFIAAHAVTNGAWDPAVLAWGACGVFGLAFGLAMIGTLRRDERRSRKGPRPL